jgi:uncharacterized protein
LRNIRDNIPNRTFKIIIRGNVNRNVLNIIDQYSDFLSEEFAQDGRFQTHWSPVGNWGGEVIDESKLCSHKDLVNPMLDAAAKGVDMSFYRDHFNAGDSVCYASKKNHFIIGSDGIIYKCTIAFEDEINHVGMITQNGTMHIDQDRFALWVTGHETADTGCQKCYFRPSCQGAGCPLLRIKTGEAPCPPVKLHFKDYMQVVAGSVNSGVEILKMVGDGVPT